MTEWISVRKELPPNSSRCLTWCKIVFNEYRTWEGIIDCHFCNNFGWRRNEDPKLDVYVTHWSPLPMGPSDEND